MKLLRTIRLDPSDAFIFAKAAEPGEWAVSGAFIFSDESADALEGKARSAFRSGFLGLQSFGWSTLVQIVNATDAMRNDALQILAQRLMEDFGAPDQDTARRAAEEELDFAASLCDHDADTLIAVHRAYENGAIRESFRTLKPRPETQKLRAFTFLEAEDDETPAENVDLVGMANGDRK